MRPLVLFLTLVLLLGVGAVISNNLDSEAYDPSRPAASDPSLAAYWKFDEGTGVITEESDNAVDRRFLYDESSIGKAQLYIKQKIIQDFV